MCLDWGETYKRYTADSWGKGKTTNILKFIPVTFPFKNLEKAKIKTEWQQSPSAK